MHVHMYTSGTVPYVPTSPPSTQEHTSEQDELERENRAYYYIQPVPRTRIGGSPRTRDPAPNPQPSPHTHTHTREQKLNSTFHFPLSLPLYRYLPTTGYKYVYSVSTVVKKSKIRLDHTYYLTLTLPTSLDHRSSFYRQYVRNLRNCRAETTYLM